MANFPNEINAASNILNNILFQMKFGTKILNAILTAVETPDVEVNITFDTKVELYVGQEVAAKIVAGHYLKDVDLEKSVKSSDNCLEFKNGSVINLLLK